MTPLQIEVPLEDAPNGKPNKTSAEMQLDTQGCEPNYQHFPPRLWEQVLIS